ncbi:MAG TPA: CmpA/NrtA family ABC transporter substrate-binding protein [Rariglobus sp.]|jgi:ABC-type nitrate/sulfonate/bicarbonate transport system substrate-binding protein|nr:CmpA/NrtA family ABC transporter substrate-binding protein [Rariglobus sp.]
MPTSTPKARNAARLSRALRIGFIALNDAAPIIVAHEHGLFRKHGLNVELSREVGWATIRDKIIYRELDAAHALGTMLVSTTLGLNCLPCDCLTGLVINTNGNSITLSEELWQRGVRDAQTMRDEIIRSRHERIFILGVVFAQSSHRIHLCDWLRSAGVDPDRDVRIVVVPPPQVFRNLVAGTIDGYCVGDPWNSLAVREQAGWCVATSADLAPGHPEKVLMVRSDFATQHSEEHLAMISAIKEAAELCDSPEFRPELVRLLAHREYLNVPVKVISASLIGPYDHGHGQTTPEPLVHFFADGANDPTEAKAQWIIDGLTRHKIIPAGVVIPPNFARKIFRSDLYRQASKRKATLLAETAAVQ